MEPHVEPHFLPEEKMWFQMWFQTYCKHPESTQVITSHEYPYLV